MRVTPTNNTLVAFWGGQCLLGSFIDMYFPFGETLGVGDPFLYAADGFRGRNETGADRVAIHRQ